MIKITPAAAEQIRNSASQGQMDGMSLRLAATRNPDGSLHYGMGFDDSLMVGYTRITSEGVELVVSESSLSLLAGMTMDYVELEAGTWQFIFMNPNDPNYKPPETE